MTDHHLKMSNKSQTLMEIFQEILAASGNSSESGINETQIVSVLREQASSSNGNEDLENMLMKMMKEAQDRLAPPEAPDPCSSYCDGDIREVMETYNSFHGYATLLVSNHTIIIIILI